MLPLLFIFLLVASVAGEKEPYLYVIYYESDDCSELPVTVRAFVGDDEAILDGRVSEEGSCTAEGVCLVDANHDYCQNLNVTVKGETTFSIDDKGLIFQCDETNTDGECSFLDQCYGSSVYPSCHFDVRLTSDLVKDPSLVHNPAVASFPDLDKHVYLVSPLAEKLF